MTCADPQGLLAFFPLCAPPALKEAADGVGASFAEMKPALDLAWRDLSWRPQFSASSDGLVSARTGKQPATGADPD